MHDINAIVFIQFNLVFYHTIFALFFCLSPRLVILFIFDILLHVRLLIIYFIAGIFGIFADSLLLHPCTFSLNAKDGLFIFIIIFIYRFSVYLCHLYLNPCLSIYLIFKKYLTFLFIILKFSK